MFKSRQAILGWVIAFLVVCNVSGLIWSNWGRVTLDYKGAPLQEVLDSLQKQAGIKVKCNLDPTTPVTIRVTKKTFPEALDVLSGITDTSWKLAYVMAPAKEDIAKFYDTWSSGERPTEWNWIGRAGGGSGGFFGGMGGGFQDDEGAGDPRSNSWNVQPVEKGELQVLLQQANILTDALFVVPASWNPKVEKLPPAGVVQRLAYKVASSVNGEADEVFLLIGDTRPSATANGEQISARPPGGGNFQFSPQNDQVNAWRDQRTQERLAKLPADKRVEAQAEIDQRKSFMEDMRNMTPEQRAAKFQEMMNDPAAQEKMEEQMAKRDSRSTPEQRLKRFKRYVERKRELRP